MICAQSWKAHVAEHKTHVTHLVELHLGNQVMYITCKGTQEHACHVRLSRKHVNLKQHHKPTLPRR